MTNWFWALFIAGQILSAGNMNYQQEKGYHEINPIYSKHPSKKEIYLTKGIETGLVFAATKIFSEYEKEILIGANTVCWGFIITDRIKGIKLGVRF